MSGGSFTLTISNRGLVRAWEQGPKVLERYMHLAVLRSVKEMARSARRNAPKAFSTLTDAINDRMPSPLVGEVVAGVDYARAVEEGTGPGGTPSWSALMDWIHKKHIQPYDPSMDEADLEFLIMQKINKTGTPPHPFMEPAFHDNKARAEERCNRAVDLALKEMNP